MKHHRLILALLAFLFIPLASSATDETSLEYKVKAIVLFNFAKYVKWPDKVFTSPTQPIRVCILGDNPFGFVFDSPEAPKQAQDRDLAVVKLPESAGAKDVSSCQILFWEEKNNPTAEKLASAMQEHSVLTVANKKTDAAVISFSQVDGKVRFTVRRKAAEALGLTMSSQLLKLAIVED